MDPDRIDRRERRYYLIYNIIRSAGQCLNESQSWNISISKENGDDTTKKIAYLITRGDVVNNMQVQYPTQYNWMDKDNTTNKPSDIFNDAHGEGEGTRDRRLIH